MKRKVTFEELLHLCDKLSEGISKFQKFQLVAVSRGGILPGVIIAKKLGRTLNIMSIDSKGDAHVLTPLTGEHVVYIDDMTDLGRTAEAVIRYHREQSSGQAVWCSVFVDHASPVLKEETSTKMGYEDYLFGEVAHDWIVMPHEEEDRVVEGDKGLFRDGSNKYAIGKEE